MRTALAFLLGAMAVLLGQHLANRWLFHARPLTLANAAGTAGEARSLRLDLNGASESDLQCVPGLGPVLSSRIVAHRLRHGPFARVKDLEKVPGLGPGLVSAVQPYFYVTRSTAADVPAPASEATGQERVSLLDLNRASRAELESLPGIGPTLAERIVADRAARGPFRTVADLTRVRGIKGKTLDKVKPHVQVSEVAVAQEPGAGS